MSGCHKPEHNSTQRAKVDSHETDPIGYLADGLRESAEGLAKAIDEHVSNEAQEPVIHCTQCFTQHFLWQVAENKSCRSCGFKLQTQTDKDFLADFMRNSIAEQKIKLSPEYIQQCVVDVKMQVEILRKFYAEYGHRLKVIEDKASDSLSPEAFGILLKRIESLQSENDTHCSAITALEDSVKSLRELIKNLIEQNQKKYASLEDELKAKLIAPMCDVSREVFTKMYPNVSQTESYVMPSKGKPHKCPLCHAAGIVFDVTNAEGLPYPNSNKIKCPPCDGSGIVWG